MLFHWLLPYIQLRGTLKSTLGTFHFRNNDFGNIEAFSKAKICGKWLPVNIGALFLSNKFDQLV